MENLTLDKEIHLVCVRATSFPDGIMAAYKKLEQIVDVKSRMVYGVSHGSDTGIIYRAAAEAGSSDEAGALGPESYTIRKGTYATETLQDFRGRNTSSDRHSRDYSIILTWMGQANALSATKVPAKLPAWFG